MSTITDPNNDDAADLGLYNPLRYRGYVYDNESSHYYLQSRYYDPALGRFINADAFASTGQGILGNNMFAYCNNNPIIRADQTGYVFQGLWQEFQQTVRDAANYFAFALGVSQADSVALGVGDVVAAGMLVGGLLYCGASAIRNVLTSTSKAASSGFGAKMIQSELGDIAGEFGDFECKKAAKSMADYLRKNGKRAEIITIHFLGGRGYVWSDIANKTISTNGVHVGILFNGIVFCNVHPLGLPEAQWVADFHGTGTKMVHKVPI